ncbi:MAG TPA: ABC transporter substrate-binding protein [candidate division Zixibacteria bacterium]|nr:ABC transporter substrate-binding protein [candidate division Zixibacteria bacterium]
MTTNRTLGFFLAACMAIFWIRPASAQPVKVAIGYSGISADQLVIWVAKETGIFARNNLDAQPIYFTGGTMSVTAMLSGDTPLIQASGPGIVSAGLAGGDPVYVVGGITTLDYWLVTQPNIKTPERLKGGTIAVARFGGAADFVARYALARLGLNPAKDVTIIQTGSTPERLAALETKRVSGSTLVPPASFIAQRKGFHVLADVAALGLAYQHQGGVTTRRFLRENPAVVRNFVKSYIEAVHRLKTDRATGMKIAAKYLRLEDPELLRRTYESSIEESKLPRKQYPTVEGLKIIIEQLARTNPKAKTARPEDFIDARFVEEFDKSGYIDSLYAKKK